MFILFAAHALGLHFLFLLHIFFPPITPGKYTFGGLDVLSANGHCRRQPVTLGLDLGNLCSIITAAQAIVTLLSSGPQLFYFSLFSADKVLNILSSVQLFPANQPGLKADTVQTAAFFP